MFKTISSELGTTSTAYGIPCLIRSKKLYQKIFWISFILGSSLASFILVKDGIFNYLDFKIVTIIQTIYEQPTEFPTITLCGYGNLFPKDKKLNEIMNDCYFGYDKSCFNKPDNYFEAFFTSEYGQCFRYNSGKMLIKSTVGGVDDSFNLKLDSNQGLSLWIHNRSSPPNFAFKDNHFKDRVFISPSTYTEITLDKTLEIKLEEPYNHCLNEISQFKQNKTIIDHFIKTNQRYGQEKCLELCFDIDYINVNPCNCTDVSLGEVWGKCWVNLEKKIENSCTWNYKVDFYSKSITEKCEIYCPLECTSISYNIRSSTFLNYSITRLKIYFNSLKYTAITQEPKMLFIDLVSNIGGTFGLLIGFSFVTFFELFELLVEFILSLRKFDTYNVKK